MVVSCEKMTKFEEMVRVHRLKSNADSHKHFHKLDVEIKHIITLYKNQGGIYKRFVVMVVELSILS